MCASERGGIEGVGKSIQNAVHVCEQARVYRLRRKARISKKYRHFEKVHEDFSGKEEGEEEEVVCEGPESGCAASVFVLFVPVKQVN